MFAELLLVGRSQERKKTLQKNTETINSIQGHVKMLTLLSVDLQEARNLKPALIIFQRRILKYIY